MKRRRRGHRKAVETVVVDVMAGMLAGYLVRVLLEIHQRATAPSR